MDNPFDSIQAAIRQARETRQACKAHATAMASLLRGNLRDVGNSDHLVALKKELRDFNIHTGRWNKK